MSINLLSTEDKRQLRAARRNVSLLRYNMLILFTLVAILVIFGAGYFIAHQEYVNADHALQEDLANTQQYQEVRQESEQFRSNLRIANRILADEVSYSTLLIDIAQALPSNAVLTSLELNPAIFNTPTNLSASTVSYEAALQLKDTLEQSDLFSDVHIINIFSSGPEGNPDAPASPFAYSVTLSAVINVRTGAASS